jgi:hypothetical protein
MLFRDFLKATVMISAGAATALAIVTLVGANADGNLALAFGAVGWWVLAAGFGAWLGRRAQTTPPIARLLASARTSPALPDPHPGRVLLNRLWPLIVSTISAGALAVVFPQVPGIATGFALIWALAWRRQEAAVAAIEDRDGVRFYVERTSPVRPIKLLRTPGFQSSFPASLNGRGQVDPAFDRGA